MLSSHKACHYSTGVRRIRCTPDSVNTGALISWTCNANLHAARVLGGPERHNTNVSLVQHIRGILKGLWYRAGVRRGVEGKKCELSTAGPDTAD